MTGPLATATAALNLAATLATVFAADPEVQRSRVLGRWASRLTAAVLAYDDRDTDAWRDAVVVRIVRNRVRLASLSPDTLAAVDAALRPYLPKPTPETT